MVWNMPGLFAHTDCSGSEDLGTGVPRIENQIGGTTPHHGQVPGIDEQCRVVHQTQILIWTIEPPSDYQSMMFGTPNWS